MDEHFQALSFHWPVSIYFSINFKFFVVNVVDTCCASPFSAMSNASKSFVASDKYYSIWDKGFPYLVLTFSTWHNFINIYFFGPTIFFMKWWSADNLCYSCGWYKFVIVSWYVCFGCIISLPWCSFSNIYCYHNWVQICANLIITDLFHLIVCPVILIKLIEPLCCQSNLYCVNWFN